MDDNIDLNPETGLELKKRCQEYIAAFDQMEAAMVDGVNVQGALSGLIGTVDMLKDQIQKINVREF